MNTKLLARELLEDLGLFCLPVSPTAICDKLGIEYIERPYEGFDGTLIIVGSQSLIGVNLHIREAGKKAFTCAHEIGHYCYDLDHPGGGTCTKDALNPSAPSLPPEEKRANEFAADLLLPRDLILPIVGKQDPSWTVVKELATQCGTSLTATAIRFVQLTHHSCWLICSKNGRVQWSDKSEFSELAIDRGSPVRPVRSSADEWHSISADAWMYNNSRTRDRGLLEWSLPANSYGEILTLLWDAEGALSGDFIDEEDEEEGRDDDWR